MLSVLFVTNFNQYIDKFIQVNLLVHCLFFILFLQNLKTSFSLQSNDKINSNNQSIDEYETAIHFRLEQKT